jgi:hypothetical protein
MQQQPREQKKGRYFFLDFNQIFQSENAFASNLQLIASKKQKKPLL